MINSDYRCMSVVIVGATGESSLINYLQGSSAGNQYDFNQDEIVQFVRFSSEAVISKVKGAPVSDSINRWPIIVGDMMSTNENTNNAEIVWLDRSIGDNFNKNRLISGRSNNILVLTFGKPDNLWPQNYTKELNSIGIKCIQFSNIEQLWLLCLLNQRSTIFLVLKSVHQASNIVTQIHQLQNIRSIYIQCESNQLAKMRRFASDYMKLDAVFNDETRLLFKIATDLALFCEQMGDWFSDDGNATDASRNYQRAQYLCLLARPLVTLSTTVNSQP